MKVIFPVKQEIANDYFNKSNTNGLFYKIAISYSRHYALTLTPDEVLNNIACVYGKYINMNAERLREKIVSHDGKKELRVYLTKASEVSWMIRGIAALVKKLEDDVETNIVSWAQCKFSTTEESDILVRGLAGLHAAKEYYEYGITLCCGLPSVELLGTQEDWSMLMNVIKEMPTLDDDFLTRWKSQLLITLSKMMSLDEVFWQSCVTVHPYGSGSQANYGGWATVFNPFNENGDEVTVVKEKDMLNLSLDIKINVDDNGYEYILNVSGGPNKAVACDDVLSVRNALFFTKE